MPGNKPHAMGEEEGSDMDFSKIDMLHAALLIIDMQEAFVNPEGALCITGAKDTVPGIVQAADVAREAGAQVIWVVRSYERDGSNMERARWADLVARGLEGAGVLAPGTEGPNSARLAEGLVPHERDLRVCKPRYSAFFGTDLARMLRDRGIDTVLLAGTTTPNCIRSTCYDALSYDFDVVVLEPLCRSNTPEIQQANIDDMQRAGTTILR
ncbi:cysteine hydrolase family protein [Curtanaerobium respiraculi]|uniref:cysteine hydrolase family protein n=1 Tax=Curtanaerobium respiraculi TaxID=2949669 RepID=UPI0024B3894D|nr:isochorismatase family cysteine hydrolase [Curtanaerobium respiraculi]